MSNIWFIRHGECYSNINKATTSPDSSSLTQRGQLQSACIANSVTIVPDMIIVSPYMRAQQSAQATVRKFPDTSVVEWPVHEFVYLPYEKYMNTTRHNRRAAADLYWERCDPGKKSSEEAESFIEFIDRMDMIYEALIQKQENILIFTHGHIIRAMLWKMITGELKKDRNGMAQYRSLRHALYISNASILKVNNDTQELQMSQLITYHLPLDLQT